MKTIISICFILLIMPGMSGQTRNTSKVKVLNLAEAFSMQQDVNLSRFVSSVTYLTLKTDPEAAIAEYAQFEVTNDFVIVRQMGATRNGQILLFDRNSGNFIREIGKQGRAPGEFMMYSLLPFNPLKKEIYALDGRGNLLIYDLIGRNTGRVNMPELKNPEATDEMNSMALAAFTTIIDNDTFVLQVPNSSGVEKRKLVLLSVDGNTKVFPNHLTWDASKFKGIYSPPAWGFAKFYIWDNQTNFIETYCDTLYQITKESMIPRYFFDWGKYNSPYSKQIWINDRKHFYDYFYITDIKENKNYIFARHQF